MDKVAAEASRPRPHLKFCQELSFLSAHETPLNHSRVLFLPPFSTESTDPLIDVRVSASSKARPTMRVANFPLPLPSFLPSLCPLNSLKSCRFCRLSTKKSASRSVVHPPLLFLSIRHLCDFVPLLLTQTSPGIFPTDGYVFT